ncbi:MAG TPA: RNA polymerase sigma factor [Myxococcales bacterium]|jgi:RNA polymerase sigma-70 factor, ECF subfamily|nr:RNA polymerase sigma factor [Myxococcales bacterium]
MEPDLSDEELLAAFQQGDAGAFERLLRRHRSPLFTFLVRMLGDRERAEDLAQEAFLRIVKGAGAWERRARFKAWLYAIARNLCADAGRRDKFRRTDSLDTRAPGRDGEEGAPLVEELAGDGPGPDRGAESARLRPVLTRALAALPEEQREVFVLREQAGVTFTEIAEMLGVNENTVKSRMRYALLGLRKALSAAGIGDDAQAAPPPQPGKAGRA